MLNPRGKWLLAVSAAVAASCWDGALDPILGGPDDSDHDTDADADTDSETGTDSETTIDTEPVPCAIDVVVYVDQGEYYYPLCDFTLEGVCRTSSAECVGCAWQTAEEDLCGGIGVCCVPETYVADCEPYYWPWLAKCGYFEGACPESSVELGAMDGQSECPGGVFCCYLVDDK